MTPLQVLGVELFFFGFLLAGLMSPLAPLDRLFELFVEFCH